MALRRTAAALADACSSAAPALAASRPQAAASMLTPAAAAQLQQARARGSRAAGIAVDVPNGNVDRAWRQLTRRLKEERYMEAAQSRTHFVKPSEERKQAAAAATKRLRKQEFKEMLQWIMRRRAGGF